ncbi:MAG TPA: SUMF1/EgtB/PvdO family nonheme iron enzyme [Rhodospirillaceae bacterium]|nr:SUMF1/EgtB/PvdO family nonheme iron enzyme [Rhodospirillaceae bacterium]
MLVTVLMVFAGGSVSSATPAPSVDRGALFWNSTKDSNNADMFQEYPRQHPNGGFAGLARLKIKKLKAARQLAVAEPPKQAAPKAAVGVYPQGFKPGTTFKDCPECPEMVVIPAGSFRMGGVSGGGGSDEKPVHTVRVPKPFAAGKFEVARGEFAAFVNATGHGSGDGCYVYNGSEWSQDGSKNWRDHGYSQTGRDPVACVN